MSRVVGLKASIYTCCRMSSLFRISPYYYTHHCIPPTLPLFPCTASLYLSSIVLSRIGGLRGLPLIGWLIWYGPYRVAPSSYSDLGLVVPVRARAAWYARV